MKFRIILAAAASMTLLSSTMIPSASAQKIARPAATKLRIDPARIDRALARMIADGRAVGVSALVWVDGREVYFGARGDADREAHRPMTRDTLIQIFSMTKPVTGVALMQLWEQGKFRIDDPLADYLPEFAQVRVYAGKNADGSVRTEAPRRPILIRDILRHTAGFSYGGKEHPADLLFDQADPLALDHDLPEFGRRLASVPLVYQPGTQWRYSAAVAVQGLLVEKLSGMPFEAYVKAHVFDPLGMKDTGWTQPAERLPRLAAGYQKGADGTLARMPEAMIRRINFAPRKLTPGDFGLVSTSDDYMRFARMLLNKGTLDGVKILKPSTVERMATDDLDPAITQRLWLPGKGNGGFGIDFFVRTGQPKTPEENRGAVGEFFWDGAWSTLFWVDPANKLTAVFLVQKAPFDGTLHRDFRKAVYGADYTGPAGD
ncbi:serine hydrolase domain-containing protein [uncultured Sphingomonas sp.]|uniref:serine hydrolase domain-containing protein n=1 Tax=uncultured Sphingomonas sp. TaxID=158754 RepID=UPI0025CE0242|nr:serine hydrolase domain-containing protein [uncultured Sphingomonas sp.]